MRIKEEFTYIRGTFFPQWDRKREWKVSIRKHLPIGASRGFYDVNSKRILIAKKDILLKDRDTLHSFLIHEICHYASPNHRERFLDRFAKAKDKAKRIGRERLAKFICYQIEEIVWGRGNPPRKWTELLYRADGGLLPWPIARWSKEKVRRNPPKKRR